jgi:hypothetical protein
MDSTVRRYGAAALQRLLGDDDLDVPWRWHRAGETPGIYFEPLAGDISQSELLAITGGLVGDNAAAPRPVLALPCELSELLAFDAAAGLFRDRLQAGSETAELLKRIGAGDQDAGEIARALVSERAAAETRKERCARLLRWYEEEVQARGQRGATERVTAREKAVRPTAHRSNVGKDIKKAREERAEAVRERGNVGAFRDMAASLVHENAPKTPARKAIGKR